MEYSHPVFLQFSTCLRQSLAIPKSRLEQTILQSCPLIGLTLADLGIRNRRLTWNLEPDPTREVFDGLRKRQAKMFNQKTQCSAMGSAAKAVIELLTRTNREGG
mgnify:CR=1 FL=1